MWNKDTICSENMRIYARSHIRIKPVYGNVESDSSCGKICDMHTSGKYANNAARDHIHYVISRY